jgi:hypothetical protein
MKRAFNKPGRRRGMWIAIFGAFVLVTVLFGKSGHQESSSRFARPQPAIAEVAGTAEPGLVPHVDGAPAFYKKD